MKKEVKFMRIILLVVVTLFMLQCSEDKSSSPVSTPEEVVAEIEEEPIPLIDSSEVSEPLVTLPEPVIITEEYDTVIYMIDAIESRSGLSPLFNPDTYLYTDTITAVDSLYYIKATTALTRVKLFVSVNDEDRVEVENDEEFNVKISEGENSITVRALEGLTSEVYTINLYKQEALPVIYNVGSTNRTEAIAEQYIYVRGVNFSTNSFVVEYSENSISYDSLGITEFVNDTLLIYKRVYDVEKKIDIAVQKENSGLSNKVAITVYKKIVQEQIPNMAYVEGGSFVLGYLVKYDNYSHSGTHRFSFVTPVTLSSFFISKYEETQSKWLDVMGNNPSVNYSNTGEHLPVNNMSWLEIIVYCNKLSVIDGLTPCYSISGVTDTDFWGDIPTALDEDWDSLECDFTANGYRLPTEAEWEFAAKGGNNSNDYIHSGSNDPDDVACYYGGDDLFQLFDVGSLMSNELDIFDMTGNLSEWCWDHGTVNDTIPVTNPTGSDDGYRRSIRGSYYNDQCTYSTVIGSGAGDLPGFPWVGFRLVRSSL